MHLLFDFSEQLFVTSFTFNGYFLPLWFHCREENNETITILLYNEQKNCTAEIVRQNFERRTPSFVRSNMITLEDDRL